MSEGKAMNIEQMGKLAWTGIQLATAAAMLGATLGGWVRLPARVDEHDEQLQQLPIMRVQLDWTTKVLADKFKIEPPDLSRFERERQRRRGNR